jgi:phage major head subunit gpT-like protein
MLVRTSFPDEYLQTMLPAIDEVVQTKYAQYPDQFSEVFRMETSTRSIEQTTEVSGFGQMAVVPENSPTRYDDPLPLYNKTYVHTQYGLGFKVSKIAMDDDKFGMIRKLSTELGRSAKETTETVAATVFNNGFNSSYPGPDGQPLFSTAHPLAAGSTPQSNRLSYASDPDVTSLQIALSGMRTQLDARGKRQRIPPRKAIFPPQLEFVAAELLGGTDRPDTANRTINAFRRRSGMPTFQEWMVWDYLSDPHAWFIEAEQGDTELRFYTREAFNTVHDIDFDTRAVKTAGWQRFSVGFNGFYGIYGVPSS